LFLANPPLVQPLLSWAGISYAMPSFLTKVFGRKKDDRDVASPPTTNKRLSQPSLEGKSATTSPTVSPSASNFPDAKSQPSTSVKENPLSLFRSRSRNPEQSRTSNVASAPVPHLTLNLPAAKEEQTPALGIVFEADQEGTSTVTDQVIGDRRLSPEETLSLVKACSSAIIDRGGEFGVIWLYTYFYGMTSHFF
jgi:hypothetical protein